jgi:hypothetical protein
MTAVQPSQREQEKATATLTAAFALAGFAVHPLQSGGFLVTRWNLSRHCSDLQALREFATRVGVRT